MLVGARRDIRRAGLVALAGWVAVALALVGGGCGCPHTAHRLDRLNAADIVLDGYASNTGLSPESWVTEGIGDTETIGLMWFKDGPAFAGMFPVVEPGDLQLLVFEPAHSTTDPAAPIEHPIGFSMIIHGIAGGPAEIDLDDTRAQLVAGLAGDSTDSFLAGGVVQHGLSGHVSFTVFSTLDCPNPYSCALSVRGTFAFSATGTDGQRTVVSNGSIRASDSTFEDSTCYTSPS